MPSWDDSFDNIEQEVTFDKEDDFDVELELEF